MAKKSAAKKTAWKWFSLFIRLRDCLRTTGSKDYGKCISCGAYIPLNGSDAGHFIPGRKDAYLFEETNCHLQCPKCNRFEQGKWVEYEEELINLYGSEEVERLKGLKRKVFRFTEMDLKEIAKKYRLKYKELMNE